MEKLGIKETKEANLDIAKLVEKVVLALQDKKVRPGEVVGISFQLPGLVSAFKNLDEIGAELEDLSPEEALELNKAFENELDLAPDSAREISAASQGVLLSLVQLYYAIKESKSN